MKTVALTFFLVMIAVVNLFSQSTSITIDSGYVNVEGGKLFYEAAGKGDNIVLLHDGMVHREIWDEQFLMLAKNYRVIRYDRQAYGKSTDPAGRYSNIEDLNQVFAQLGIDKATVFGMSAGGGLAIDFTLKYPDKVTALVLVGAVVSGYGYTPHMTNRGGNIKSFEMFSDPLKVVQYFVMEDPYEIYSENVRAKERVMKLMLTNPHQSNGGTLLPPDRSAAKYLSEIKIPTLVIVGEYDIPDVHWHAGVIHFGIPNAKREIILKSGHLVPIEQPEDFNNKVNVFLYNMRFHSILTTQGIDSAVQYFHLMHSLNPDTIFLNEQEINALGYKYLQEWKTEDAIKLFQVNAIAFPNSYNVYDSLGEALLKNGHFKEALSNYTKSLEINPDNTNATQMINKLKF